MDDDEFRRKLAELDAPRTLKVYDETDDADSSVEHKYLGTVKVRLPRRSRILLGYTLMILVLAASVAVVLAAWRV